MMILVSVISTFCVTTLQQEFLVIKNIYTRSLCVNQSVCPSVSLYVCNAFLDLHVLSMCNSIRLCMCTPNNTLNFCCPRLMAGSYEFMSVRVCVLLGIGSLVISDLFPEVKKSIKGQRFPVLTNLCKRAQKAKHNNSLFDFLTFFFEWPARPSL